MKKIIAANLISGISLICLIVFGISYIQFKNTPIYDNYKIEIVNNPITGDKDIEFVMVGRKVLNCQAKNVHGIATLRDGTKTVKLDQFATMYMRNIQPGETVTNTWSFKKPEDLTPGHWRVDMVGDWTCRHFIFTNLQTIRNHENILLIVE